MTQTRSATTPAAAAGPGMVTDAAGMSEYRRNRESAQLVPQARLPGPTPWVVAIMVALTTIAAAAGLALAHIGSAARSELAGGLTVQILDANPVTRTRSVSAILAILGHEPGVGALRVVPDRDVKKLLSPWLGTVLDTSSNLANGDSNANANANSNDSGGDSDTIPVPALIDAHLDRAVTPARIDAIRHALLQAGPSVRVDAQAGWLRPVFTLITSLTWLVFALIMLLALAMSAAVLLAARTALGQHHATIEIIHLLGGTDRQIAHIFERSIGIDAAMGGGVGFVVAASVVVILGQRFGNLDAGMVNGGALGMSDWIVLLFVPLAGVGLAMLTARVSVLASLKKVL